MIGAPGQGRGVLTRRIAIAGLVALMISVVAFFAPPTNILQGWISDFSVAARAAAFGIRPLDSDKVLVVGMDKRSLDAEELLSTPRTFFTPVYAELADKLFSHGAKGLLFDIIIAYDAKNLEINEETPLRRYDVPFLKLLRAERQSGRVVLGWSTELLPARRYTKVAGLGGMGLIQIPYGASSVIRRVPTSLQDVEGQALPTLSGRALELLGEAEPPEWVSIMAPASLTTLPSASLIDLLRCDDPERLRAMVEGRVVFLGGMLPGEDRLKTPDQMVLWDLPEVREIDPNDHSVACDFPAPNARTDIQPTLPGVYIHAAAADAVASGWRVEPVAAGVVAVVTFGTCLVAGVIAFFSAPAIGVALLTTALALLLGLSVAALEAGHFIPTAWTVTGAPLAFLVCYGLRIRLLDRKATLIRREFGKYLSPVLVQQMIDAGQMPDLGGEEREATIMFADLSGFTAASEILESAELMALLNRYLDRMAGIIRDHEGYIDKFIGDAVMALFNAPVPLENHAVRAVEAAHVLTDAVLAMAAADRASGALSFSIKVGIASGPVTVGNVGSQDRMNYTVIGETVNLAARLEGLPGLFGTPVVINEAVAEAVRDRYALLRLVSIQVKGKTEGVSIYAPFRESLGGPHLIERISQYHDALEAFETGAFAEAEALWERLGEIDWPGRNPAIAMASEARRLGEQAADRDWSGVLQARSK